MSRPVYLGVVLLLALSGCKSRPDFIYAPGAKPINPNGSLYDWPGGVKAFDDLTIPLPYERLPPIPPGQHRLDLMEDDGGLSSWPQMTGEAFAQAFADELEAAGVVSTAAVVDDEWAAAGNGARLYVTGEVNEASETHGSALGGVVVLDVSVDAALSSGGSEFDYDALHQIFHVSVAEKGRRPQDAEIAALNELYAQVLAALVQAMQTPAAQIYMVRAQP